MYPFSFGKMKTALREWKQRKGRKPLLVNGARQIGKTFSINEFGRDYLKIFLPLPAIVRNNQ
jgi:predicted AAA+ superfamily ATPase